MPHWGLARKPWRLSIVLGVLMATGCASESTPITPSPCNPQPGINLGVEKDPDVWVSADMFTMRPDGKEFAASCFGKVCIWDAATGKLRLLNRSSGALDWSTQGILAIKGGRCIDLVSPSDGVTLETIDAGPYVVNPDTPEGDRIAFSPDGETLGNAGRAHGLVEWDVKTLKRLPSTVTGGHAMAWHPKGDRLVVTAEGQVLTLGARGGQWIRTKKIDSQAKVIRYSPDGSTIAIGGAQAAQLTLLDAQTLSPKGVYPASDRVLDLAFSPDGRQVAFVQYKSTDVSVLTIASGEVRTLTGLQDPPRSVRLAPDGKLYTVGTKQGVVEWDAEAGRIIREFERLPA